MTIKPKLTPFTLTPSFKGVKDGTTQGILEQFGKVLYGKFNDIYNDLVHARTDRVDTLPTAGKDYLGRFMLKANAGADDTLHICIYQGATSDYAWNAVTIS